MSSRLEALSPARRRSAGLAQSATVANWLRAAGIGALIVAVFAVVHALEMGAGRWKPNLRVAGSPSEAAVRYVGISHFLLAFLFLASSKRMRAIAPWGAFAGKLAGGALLCLGYAALLALNAPLAGVLFAAYFLVHDSRDQVHFYFVHGEAPKGSDSARLRRALTWPPFLVLGAIAALGAAALSLGGRSPEVLQGLPAGLRSGIVAAALGTVAAAAARWRAIVRQEEPRGTGAFLRTHRPIFLVWAGTLLLVLLDLILTGEVRLIVLLHVTCWYVFVHGQTRRRPPEVVPRPGSWRWMRTTASGFAALHAGLALALVAAGALWAYGFQGSPELSEFRVLLDKKSFPFWTILHVTVSLGRP